MENQEQPEMITVDALKDMINKQMEGFESMNQQISAMLDGFDEKINDLTKRVEDIKKKKQEEGGK